jgi:hypothetical protein
VSNSRNQARRQLAGLYYSAEGCSNKCIYCGAPNASTKDHVPPITVAASLPVDDLPPLLLYPCCEECNSLLGDRFLLTVEERSDFIAGALRKRYARALKQAHFEEDELEEFGPGLRSMLQTTQRVGDVVRQRIAHAEIARYH